MADGPKVWIESEQDVKAYLQNLRYALDNGARISFQIKRLVDEKRDEKYMNQYTVNTLFPDESPADALKRELKALTAEEYIRNKKA